MPPIPSRIADLGCGTGTLSLLLVEEGHRVDGVDFSPEMLRRAEAKVGSFPGTRFLLGDAADPPLSPGEYDVVLVRHVLWALPDPAAALLRWIELLAPRRTAGADRGELVDRRRSHRRPDLSTAGRCRTDPPRGAAA